MLEYLKLNVSSLQYQGDKCVIFHTENGYIIVTEEQRVKIIRLQNTEIIKELLCLEKALDSAFTPFLF